MSNHTVGPWHMSGKTVYALNEQGFNRFSALVQDAHTGEEELEANARLIAAAPDLLEALMMARDALATALRTAAPDWFETKEDIDAHVGINQIDTAIAKATGEAQ